MPSVQQSDIADFVASTLPELGRLKFTDLMSDYQNTIALKRTMKKNKMNFDSGRSVSFNVITDHNHSARFTGLAEVDVVDIPNVMTTGDVPWRHITWNWAMERRLIAMNRAPAKIVDVVMEQRTAAFGAAIIAFERAFWRVPGSTDTKSPYGVPYWVVKSNTATSTNNGFNGTVPSGYTVVGALNPTSYPRWANYATQYTSVTKDDLIRKVRRMLYYTDFMPLVDDMPVYNTGDDYGLYTNYAVYSVFQEILESQNENLGEDVAPMDGGGVLFKRKAITPVIELDSDTTNPFYALNWGEFKAMGLTGEWMNETHIPIKSDQHTVSVTHTDCSFNWFCRNRRRNGVVATDTTLPA